MSQDKRSMFAQIFTAMMIFCGLVWFWVVVFIMAWPWTKSSEWRPEFRIPAVCADGELCGIPHGELAKGQFKSLSVPDAAVVMEDKNWLRWTTQNGVVEAKTSSWHFRPPSATNWRTKSQSSLRFRTSAHKRSTTGSPPPSSRWSASSGAS